MEHTTGVVELDANPWNPDTEWWWRCNCGENAGGFPTETDADTALKAHWTEEGNT